MTNAAAIANAATAATTHVGITYRLRANIWGMEVGTLLTVTDEANGVLTVEDGCSTYELPAVNMDNVVEMGFVRFFARD